MADIQQSFAAAMGRCRSARERREKMKFRRICRLSLLLTIGVFGLSPFTAARAENVRAYCAKKGDDDHLKGLPAELVQPARQIFGLSSDVSDRFIRTSTRYRCMGGKAWLCNYGANLVCDKANASRTSSGASAFCKDNPDAENVPMFATGHDTVYSWKCVGREARVDEQVTTIDARGFIAENWKQLQ
ncbi:hypothetical protein LG047_04340 [Methylocystis sp. WRRC1]|uniref:hypothetical protein n=1 Tax=unclassified Methylocystis TaxID=2625913 RepID=UPI001186D2AE|nr:MULTISPECIES: hypothetical protein [unclassified Methylocystis]MCC3244557.1 hypothetical protein [Methylocystis sp. WRRC1]